MSTTNLELQMEEKEKEPEEDKFNLKVLSVFDSQIIELLKLQNDVIKRLDDTIKKFAKLHT